MPLTRKLTAEFIGTFWLVLGGCGSAVRAAAFPHVGIGPRYRAACRRRAGNETIAARLYSPRRNSFSPSIGDLTLPMSPLVVPMRTALFPTVRNPAISMALMNPPASDPNVIMAAVIPIPRRPNVARARRRHRLNA